MGRGFKGKNKRKAARANDDGPPGEKKAKVDSWANHVPIVMENAALEEYYKTQKIVPEEEWDQFWATFKDALPTTFRINGIADEAAEYNNRMIKKFFGELENVVVDEKKIEPPSQLPWYPGGLGWYYSVPRAVLRKSPPLQRFHEFLTVEAQLGRVSRQEAVSMIPPFFLDVKPNHRILDLCAAPGSKTAQLLEFLHADGLHQDTEGIVVANDSDSKRCNLLVHQATRINSPSMVVTNHDARQIPQFDIEENGVRVPLEYDRVLADVPCSGDGTIRKNPDIWKKWGSGHAAGLHKVQSAIAFRGAQLLKVGGTMVYSTCSMNPIENEAVIVDILRKAEGALELVDVSDRLPGLKRRSGLLQWKVQYRSREWCDKIEEVMDDRKANSKAVPSHFCPPLEEAKEFGLEKCVRCYPHLQDTGGFFIAVFRKVKALGRVRGKPEGEEEGKETPQETSLAPPADRFAQPGAGRDPRWKEERFYVLPENTLETIKDFYGLRSDYPIDRVMQRGESGKSVYYLSKLVKNLIDNNLWYKMKIVSAAVKMFDSNSAKDSGCSLRLCMDAVPVLLPSMTKRIIQVPEPEFVRILQERRALFDKDEGAFPELIRKARYDCESVGCLVMEIDPATMTKSHFSIHKVTMWRGRGSVTVFIPPMDARSLLADLGIDLPPLSAGNARLTKNANTSEKDGASEADPAAATATDAAEIEGDTKTAEAEVQGGAKIAES